MNYKETHCNEPNIGDKVAFILRWGHKNELIGEYTDKGFVSDSKVYGYSMDVVRWRKL